jgi:N-acetylneuraminic acid mutarotase/pimeloyl-ACP methyl ester carboxylesterase
MSKCKKSLEIIFAFYVLIALLTTSLLSSTGNSLKATASTASDFAWSQKTDLPEPRSCSAIAVCANKIYVLGGGYRLSNYMYDPSNNTWHIKSAIPAEGTDEGGAVALNNKLYVLGNGFEYAVKIYDTLSDSWTTGASMPTARRGFGMATVNWKIYVIGGGDSSLNGFSTVEEYDPTTNSWTTKANMPTPRSFFSVAVVDNLIYAIGGLNRDSGNIGNVEVYDPATDTWLQKSSMPLWSRHSAATVVMDGKIYMIGGSAGNEMLSQVIEYDPVTDTWTIKNPISVPRMDAVAGVVNNKIYVIGGRNYGNNELITDLQSVEEGTLGSVTPPPTTPPPTTPPPTTPPPTTPPPTTPPPTTPPPTTPPPTVTLTLYVRNGSTTGPIIAGASVTGSDVGGSSFSQTTNANGYVTITGAPGMWQFSVSKTGYQINSWSQSITTTSTKTAYLIANVSMPTPTSVASFSTSNPSPPDYLSPVFDEDITFDASGSQPSLDAAKIVNYYWDFGDGTPFVNTENPEIIHAYPDDSVDSYKSERSCNVTLTVTDDKGRSASASLDLIIKRPPVLLVHGLQLTAFKIDDTWGTMAKYLTGDDISYDQLVCNEYNEYGPFGPDYCMKYLEGNGFTVYLSCYTHDTSSGTKQDIRLYAQNLSQEIQLIKETEDVSKVDIVAHSMGGLVSRTYIENADLLNNPYAVEYQHDVRKLIMLGTPNHGTYLAELFSDIPGLSEWDSAKQISPANSEFLLPLNTGTTGESEGVEYSAIAGNLYGCDHINLDCLKHPSGGKGCTLAPIICKKTGEANDYMVTVNSVKLPELRWFEEYQLDHGQLAHATGPVVQYMLDMSTIADTDPIQAPNLDTAQLCSPGELRAYDSQGRVTGLVNGETVEEIPGSTYDSETNTIIIFSTDDSFYWEVVGTDEGTYGLDITNDSNGEVTSFIVTNVSTTNGATHNYAVDWTTIAQGGNGVTLEIDSDGDGEFEETQHLSATGDSVADDEGGTNWALIGGIAGGALLLIAIVIAISIRVRGGKSAKRNRKLKQRPGNKPKKSTDDWTDF